MTATRLLKTWTSAGISIRAVDTELYIRPDGIVTPTVRRWLEQHRLEVIAELDPDVAWRVEAMRPQVPPPPAAIPVLMARPDVTGAVGCCMSCSDSLPTVPEIGTGVCDPCRVAASLVMRSTSRAAPIGNQQTPASRNTRMSLHDVDDARILAEEEARIAASAEGAAGRHDTRPTEPHINQAEEGTRE